jgi:hypothetical protein
MATDTAADCIRCHFPNTWGGLNDEPAQTVIAVGKGAGTSQTCEDCHTAKGVYLLHGLTDDAGADGVVDVHDNLAIQSGISNSACADCHTASTVTERLQTHTQGASGYDCLTCHTAGTPTSTVIAASSGGSADPAQCNECHTANWDTTHAAVDHSARVTADTSCTSCNEGDPGTDTTAPNSVATPYIGTGEIHESNFCYTCHDDSSNATRGTYLTQAAANVQGYVGAMPSAPANCSDCHTAYFDGHATHTATSGHTVSYDGGTADQVLGGTGCGDCHTPISTWSEIASLHNYAGCGTCHGYDGVTGEFNNTPSGTVASVILTSGATTCADCHTNKAGQQHGYLPHNTDNGLGYAPITADADCITCHGVSGDNVVSVIRRHRR